MRRRDFVTLLGSAAVAWPLAIGAQEAGRTYHLAVLSGNPRVVPQFDAFFDELRLNGFLEGQNLVVDARGFGLRNEQFAAIAAAIIKTAPDVIFAGGDLAARKIQEATHTIPIVAITDDMIAAGHGRGSRPPASNTTRL